MGGIRSSRKVEFIIRGVINQRRGLLVPSAMHFKSSQLQLAGPFVHVDVWPVAELSCLLLCLLAALVMLPIRCYGAADT